MSVNYGTRLGNELLTFVKAHERIRPLRDQIVIEPLPLDLNSSIEVVYRGKPVRGIIRAAGRGCYPIKYLDSNGNPTQRRGDRKTLTHSKHFRPCDLKVGDVVDIGGLDIGGYLFPLIRWGDIDVVICREEDVALLDEAATEREFNRLCFEHPEWVANNEATCGPLRDRITAAIVREDA